jgi:signal transduction histidine kinase
MVIYDDGNRFVQNEYSSGQGLKNMQMRAEKIGGRVIYKNENGFSVILTAPPIK